MKGGDNDGWWRREVVTKGSGDEGKGGDNDGWCPKSWKLVILLALNFT